MCYRRENALAAITFKGIMDRDPVREYGNIWYSNLEGVGNFILDIPEMIGEAEWIVFFVGKAFTAGFLDENEINPDCVTALELIAIEKERQKRKNEGKPFHLMTVNVDGGYFDKQCAKDIKQLFLVAGILREDSVAAYKGLNQNPYHSTSTLPYDFIEENLAPYCALPVDQAEKPMQTPTVSAEKAGILTPTTGSDAASTAAVQKNNSEENRPKTADNLKWLENGNVLFGHYPQTATGKEKPIEWLVLKKEANIALLISRYALVAKAYNDECVPVTWSECTLRKWLNGRREDDFLQVAFTAEEQKQIETVVVYADGNPNSNANPGNATKDKVFLLSIPEANELFSSDDVRRCAPTDFAKEQGAYTDYDYRADGRPACCWWLRTPGRLTFRAAFVIIDGSVYMRGDRVNNDGSVNMSGDCVYGGRLCVRPALWINL